MRPAFPKEELRSQLQSFGRTWLRWKSQRCDWCRAELTQDDLNAYVDFTMQLGKLLPPVQKALPKPKVPCIECAGGAISEIIDGIPFSPNVRQSTKPADPWSRPRWSEDPEQRERYP